MPRYEIHYQQFGVVGGQKQQAPEFVLIADATNSFSPEARKGQLFLVVEAAHESVRERAICQQAARALRKAFYDDKSYSITQSLSKAIEKVNAQIYQQNFNTSAQKRVFIGLTCAVIKDHNLYIAQVQPTQALLLAEGNLRALPTNPTWNSSAEPSGVPFKPNSLGASLTIEPAFARATLRSGDALILGASQLAPALRRDVAEYLLRQNDAVAVAEDLELLAKEIDVVQAHGLVIHIGAAQQSARAAAETSNKSVPESTGGLATLFQSRTRRERDQRRDMRRDQAEREQRQLENLPEEAPPLPREPLRIQPLEPTESLAEKIAQVRDERMTRLGALPSRPQEHDLTPSSFLGEGDYIVPEVEQRYDLGDPTPRETFTTYARRSTGQIPDLNPTIGERFAEPFTRVTAAFRSRARNRSARRRMPPSALPPRKKGTGLSYRKEGPSFPWIQLGLLVAIIMLAVVYGYNLLENNSRQQQTEVLDQARQTVGALRSAPDAAAAQKLLDEAAIALDSVRATGVLSGSQQRQQEFASLQREYEQVQAEVQRITYFEDITDLGKHPQADAGNRFTTVVVPPPPTSITNTLGYESIYALDSDLGIIYQMPKNGGPMTPLLSPNQTIEGDVRVGQVRALAWRFDNIVAVGQGEGSGYVYYFRNGPNWSISNLGGSNEWRRDANQLKFATYEGNLYFWGALPAQILKYTSGRPGDLYTPWINNYGDSDVASAIDLAIDGNLYLLRPDGRIEQFAQNAFEKELPAAQVEPALTAVSGFVVTGQDPSVGSIFILDAANNRVVQVDKQTGATIQQIRMRPDNPLRLDGLSAITVDTTGAQPQVYLVNHGHLLRATVPNPPRAYQPANAAPSAEAGKAEPTQTP